MEVMAIAAASTLRVHYATFGGPPFHPDFGQGFFSSSAIKRTPPPIP